MTDNLRPAVGEIIENFKARLDKSVCAQISNTQFTELAQMIEVAISGESRRAATILEDAARKLRAGSRSSELEL